MLSAPIVIISSADSYRPRVLPQHTAASALGASQRQQRHISVQREGADIDACRSETGRGRSAREHARCRRRPNRPASASKI